MCIILDVNCLAEFNDEHEQDMGPVRKWLDRDGGKIAYAPTQQFEKEWSGVHKRKQLDEWSRAGKLKMKERRAVEEEAQKLDGKIQSDDPHIVALARVANVKVLVSHDRDLHKDFTDPDLVGGKVYQNKSHHRLLVKDMCP